LAAFDQRLSLPPPSQTHSESNVRCSKGSKKKLRCLRRLCPPPELALLASACPTQGVQDACLPARFPWLPHDMLLRVRKHGSTQFWRNNDTLGVRVPENLDTSIKRLSSHNFRGCRKAFLLFPLRTRKDPADFFREKEIVDWRQPRFRSLGTCGRNWLRGCAHAVRLEQPAC
jgi:hypothetical protein